MDDGASSFRLVTPSISMRSSETVVVGITNSNELLKSTLGVAVVNSKRQGPVSSRAIKLMVVTMVTTMRWEKKDGKNQCRTTRALPLTKMYT